MRFVLNLIMLIFLCFSCNENQSIAVDRIIDNSPIEGEPRSGDNIKIGEHLPKFIYHKIVDQPFVKEKISALEEIEIDHIFWVNKSELDTHQINVQILAENEIRWIPIFNFMYDRNTKELFQQVISKKTLNDSLILIE